MGDGDTELEGISPVDPENSEKHHSCQAAEQHSQCKEEKAWLCHLECVSKLVFHSGAQLHGGQVFQQSKSMSWALEEAPELTAG